MASQSLSAPVAPGHPVLQEALARAQAQRLTIGELIGVATALPDDQAATLYKTWAAYNGAHPGLHAILFNMSVCLTGAGDVAAAINALREATRIQPGFGPAAINLGGLLERAGHADQAVETWMAALSGLTAVTGDALDTKLLLLKQVGRVLEGANKDAAAEDALRQSLALNPDQQDVIQHWIALRQRQCIWPALAPSGTLKAETLRANMSPLSAGYHADDPMFQLAIAHRYARRGIGLPPRPAKRLEVVRDEAGSRRLRVGYVSSDFREHAVGFGMTQVLELHDRSQVEVFAYYCGIATSDTTQDRTKRAVEHWTDLTGLDDATAAQLIRRDGVDILVDLNGYTKDARTKVFAMRPAPVAVNWFGFPGSMGSPYHHYIVADDTIIPSDYEQFYSERVLRLPCYQPNDPRRSVAATPSREQAGLPAEGVVFCCLNGMQKLTEECFRDWMTILHHVPGSVLWLLSGTPETNDRLRQAATALGIDAARLVFADKRRNPEHLARMPLADLFLDTFPYGAHTTGSDALWMGLPVLTRRGRSFASRVCASLVTAAGVPELACETREAYIAEAIALANDPSRLSALRSRLAAGRDTCTLFDMQGLVRNLEALYRQMNAAPVPQPNLVNLEIYHELAAAEDVAAVGALDDAGYLDHYRQRLADLDSVFPVPPDGRLWEG